MSDRILLHASQKECFLKEFWIDSEKLLNENITGTGYEKSVKVNE